jgi:hypothetical protein
MGLTFGNQAASGLKFDKAVAQRDDEIEAVWVTRRTLMSGRPNLRRPRV